MIEMYFRHWHEIDVHDHFRQGLLGIERLWHTHRWEIRLFSTLLVVNAYMLYKYERNRNGHGQGVVDFYHFVDFQLVKVGEDNQETATGVRRGCQER